METKASKITYEIPNAKDKAQWLAGGTLRNETYAGGVNFSPINIPNFSNEKSGIDTVTAMLNGNFEFLNGGFNQVKSLLHGGMLDLMRNDRDSEVVVMKFEYDVTITDTTTGLLINSSFGTSEGSFNGGELGISSPNGVFSLADIQEMYKNQIDLNNLMFQSPVMIGLTMLDLMTQKSFSFEKTVGSTLIGTTIGTFRSAVTESIAKSLGVVGVQGMVLGQIIGVAFGELAELALGLDNHFGFGGELQDNKYGKDSIDGFEEGYNLEQSLGYISKATGFLEYNYDVNVADKSGNVIGSNSYYGYEGTSDSYGVDVTTNYDALNESYTHEVEIDDIGTYNTIGDGGYSFDGKDGSFESNVDGISVTSNPMGGYDVSGVDTLGNDISYSTNSTGDFSSSSSSDSDSSSGSDNDNGDNDSDGEDDGTSDNGW